MRQLIALSFLLLGFTTNAQSVKRIVALSPSSVEMLYAIGVGDSVVATVEYADFPEAAKKIKRVGSYVGVQIENIVALKPDLIIAWRSGNKQSDLKKLESLGFDLLYVDPITMQKVRDDMLRLGKKIGVEENAQAAVDKFDKKYHSIKNQYKNKSSVRVFYQLWYDPIRTVGENSWVQSLIEDCNGQNIFKGASAPYPVVSMESVLSKNPETIVMASHSEKKQSTEKVWNKWKMLSAVKNEQIHVVDGSKLLRAGPRAIEGLALLCTAIDKARTYQ